MLYVSNTSVTKWEKAVFAEKQLNVSNFEGKIRRGPLDCEVQTKVVVFDFVLPYLWNSAR